MLINSTAAYIFTYLLSYLFYQLITLVSAHLLGIPADLYYYEILYGIPNLSPEWTHGRMLVVSGLAPVLSMVAGYFLLFNVARNYPWKHQYLMLVLWLGFHMSNAFLGGFLAGTITDHGFGYALDVLFWPVFFIYILLSLIGLISLVLLGRIFTESFLRTNSSGYWFKRKNRRQFLVFTLAVPWLIGSILMVLIKYTDKIPQHDFIAIHDLILSMTMVFLIVPMFFKIGNAKVHTGAVSGERKQTIWWSLIISTIVFLLLFRLVLTDFFYSLFI